MVKPLTHIIKLFSFRGKKFYSLIRSVTGLKPRSIEIYELAFIHKSSMVKDKNKKIVCNERLEFLGDAMLGAIVADELYNYFPSQDEGFLTKTRSRIVNRALLNNISLKMGLATWIKVQPQID